MWIIHSNWKLIKAVFILRTMKYSKHFNGLDTNVSDGENSLFNPKLCRPYCKAIWFTIIHMFHAKNKLTRESLQYTLFCHGSDLDWTNQSKAGIVLIPTGHLLHVCFYSWSKLWHKNNYISRKRTCGAKDLFSINLKKNKKSHF